LRLEFNALPSIGQLVTRNAKGHYNRGDEESYPQAGEEGNGVSVVVIERADTEDE
jgi:hypothetical protein